MALIFTFIFALSFWLSSSPVSIIPLPLYLHGPRAIRVWRNNMSGFLVFRGPLHRYFLQKNHFGIYLYFIKKYLFKVSVTFREVRPDVRRTESYFQIELNLFRTGNGKEESLIKQV